jgi:aryl-alcohol dehydrogenase-like predicted oxidoreductase
VRAHGDSPAGAEAVPTRSLGASGVEVGAVGYGAMAGSGIYGPADEAESVGVLRAALDLGMTLVDTADVYGDGENELLVGRSIAGRRDAVVLATKFGGALSAGALISGQGRPERVHAAIDASLRRLGVDAVDLWYLHRVDPTTPIVETVGAMAEVVAAGKARQLGLCEVSPQTLRAAHAVHPIAAVQHEYSLLTRDPERDGILTATRELGVSLVAYSPVSRGLLSGALNAPQDLPDDDRRPDRYPRFRPENLATNLDLSERLVASAATLGATPAQVALAWVLHQGEHVIPIVGTRSLEHLRANAAAARLQLDADTLQRLDTAFPPGIAAGQRYTAAMMDTTGR